MPLCLKQNQEFTGKRSTSFFNTVLLINLKQQWVNSRIPHRKIPSSYKNQTCDSSSGWSLKGPLTAPRFAGGCGRRRRPARSAANSRSSSPCSRSRTSAASRGVLYARGRNLGSPLKDGPREISGCLMSTDRPADRGTWHGSWAAAAGLFGPSAGAEAATVKGSAVVPPLPGHSQGKRRPLRDRDTAGGVRARRATFQKVESLRKTYLYVLGSDAHPHRVRARFLGRVRNAVGSVAVVQHH